ncbi:MAG: hypothetical protein M1823_001695 [Watsoniomyces obsoletus]|nr:MAG: hypothetical protein M1823_001695 [Watsoniomyces obsoletus]
MSDASEESGTPAMAGNDKAPIKMPSLAQTYRQAAKYFVTRRPYKAIQLLDSVIRPATPTSRACDSEHEDVANAPRRLRIKTWCLYITSLDALIQLGPEEGVETIGQQEWNAVISKVRDGGIWDDVIRYGYHGEEERVDAKVVLNLALLSLAHAPSQKPSQRRVERWLKATEGDLEQSMHSDKTSEQSLEEQSFHSELSTSTNQHHGRRRTRSRMTVLEIYALYFLPRTQGWDRTKRFIETTSYLDQERRDLFLQQLESLRKEQEEQDDKERRKEKMKGSSRAESEKGNVTSKQHLGNGFLPGNTRENGTLRPNTSKTSPATSKNPTLSRRTQNTSNKLSVPGNVAGTLIRYIHSCFPAFGALLRINPFFYLRTLLFLAALLLSLTRGEFRERVKRITATGWRKLRDTVGMGVKVTYM